MDPQPPKQTIENPCKMQGINISNRTILLLEITVKSLNSHSTVLKKQLDNVIWLKNKVWKVTAWASEAN